MDWKQRDYLARMHHWEWGCNWGGSVITHNVPDYAIVVGNPGRIIKYRFDDQTTCLLKKSQWWNWPDNVIKENIELFQETMTADLAAHFVEISKMVL